MGLILDIDRLMYQADKICMFCGNLCLIRLFQLTTKATD